VLTAAGEVRFSEPRSGEHPGTPTLIAIADAATPRLVVDGELFDARTGRDLGPLAYAYEGSGSELVALPEPRGVSYNGLAMQAFRGDHETAAAIVQHPTADRFHVAHLEVAR